MVNSEEHGTMIQLQGDQAQRLHEWLLKRGLVNNENVRVHGVVDEEVLVFCS